MALDFDGVDDSVNVGSGAHLDDLANFTWCAWIRPDSLGEGGVGRVFDKFGKLLYLFATDTFGAFIDRATDTDILAPNNTLTMGAWNFVAITFDGTTTKLFHGAPGAAVLDVSPADNGSGAPVSEATSSLIIGNEPGGGATFDGRIADARVFDVALAAAELTSLMYGRPVRGANLKGWWPLDGASPEPDWSGNGANGTVTGAVVADGPPIPAPFAGDDWGQVWAAAASGVSGTIAAALAGFTSAIQGSPTVNGSMAAALNSFTSAISGSPTVNGTISALVQAFASAISGTVTVTGTIAATMGNFIANMVEAASAGAPAFYHWISAFFTRRKKRGTSRNH